MTTGTQRIHSVLVPNWRPALVNELVGVHWATASARKKQDRSLVHAYCMQCAAPPAAGRRKVSMAIEGPFRRYPDPDSPWKSVLDALVASKRLVDDSARWVEIGGCWFSQARIYNTTIRLEDL